MFERYTEKARRVIFFARYFASVYGGPQIEIPHLLLAIEREDPEVLSTICQADPGTLERAMGLSSEPAASVPASVDMPLSHACKRALAFGAEESERMGLRNITPGHILLGILREDGPEAAILRNLGADLESARLAFRPSGPVGQRRRAERVLAEVPEDRLEAAFRLLEGLGEECFRAEGFSSTGPFSFRFGLDAPVS